MSVSNPLPVLSDQVLTPGAPGRFADAIRLHLGSTQLVWALHRDGCDLLIPGHAPVPYLTTAADMRRLNAGGLLPFYEEVTTLVLSFLLDRYRLPVFFDVGASDGYFSQIAATFAGNAVGVHAFEMRKEAAARLQHLAATELLFRNIAVHHAGLTSEHRGEVDVWMARTRLFEDKPGAHEYQDGLGRRVRSALRHDRTRSLKSSRVLMTSVDAFVASTGVVPDIIKIDVEGYEGLTLAGARHVLAEHRPFVLLELHRDKKLRAMSRRDVSRMVLGHGYRALFFTDHEDRRSCDVIEVDADHALLGRQETDLLLFYHPERM
jgi:FkbM family methyltransferase